MPNAHLPVERLENNRKDNNGTFLNCHNESVVIFLKYFGDQEEQDWGRALELSSALALICYL